MENIAFLTESLVNKYLDIDELCEHLEVAFADLSRGEQHGIFMPLGTRLVVGDKRWSITHTYA